RWPAPHRTVRDRPAPRNEPYRPSNPTQDGGETASAPIAPPCHRKYPLRCCGPIGETLYNGRLIPNRRSGTPIHPHQVILIGSLIPSGTIDRVIARNPG